MSATDFSDFLAETRINAILAWTLVGAIGVVCLESALTGDLLWAVFAAFVGLMAALPAIVTGDRRSMPPWEIVLIASLPIVSRAVATVQITSTIATYLSIAALALLIAVNLHTFTAVEMSVGFAVLFVVVTTLAVAGLWALVRWFADASLGTALLLVPGPAGTVDLAVVETRLMWEFVGAGVAGLVAGVVFEAYVRRRSTVEPRLEAYR